MLKLADGRAPPNPSTRFGVQVLPCEVVPSAVLLFRLMALPAGALSPGSSVVAWGAFPVCEASLSLLQGR